MCGPPSSSPSPFLSWGTNGPVGMGDRDTHYVALWQRLSSASTVPNLPPSSLSSSKKCSNQEWGQYTTLLSLTSLQHLPIHTPPPPLPKRKKKALSIDIHIFNRLKNITFNFPWKSSDHSSYFYSALDTVQFINLRLKKKGKIKLYPFM